MNDAVPARAVANAGCAVAVAPSHHEIEVDTVPAGLYVHVLMKASDHTVTEVYGVRTMEYGDMENAELCTEKLLAAIVISNRNLYDWPTT